MKFKKGDVAGYRLPYTHMEIIIGKIHATVYPVMSLDNQGKIEDVWQSESIPQKLTLFCTSFRKRKSFEVRE